MKFIKLICALVGLLVIAAGVFLYLNFGSLVKNTAQKIASDALGVKVTISSLDISLKEKRVTVYNVKIANPPKFKNRHIITADNIVIGLNTASRQLIDFKDINVNGTVINLEVTERGTNLKALQKLTQAKKQKQSVGAEQIRVIVRNMVINQSTINPSVTLLSRDIGSIKLPAVRVSGIGQRDNGVIAQDAVRQVMMQYLKTAENKVRREGLLGNADAVIKEVEDAVDDVKNTLKGLFN